MMKIIVSHAYSKENKGDAALLSVLLSDIRRAFKDPHVTVLTLDNVKKNEIFEGVPVKNTFMYYARAHYKNPLLQATYATFVATSTLAWACLYRCTGKNLPLPKYLQEIVFLYRDADLIVPVGGGYILSKSGFINTIRLFFVLHPLLIGYILGKPTINYTQSIGYFGSKFQEAIAKFVIKRLTGVIVRENNSFELLRSWGMGDNVFLSTDSGFSFESDVIKDLREEFGISKERMTVGITVRSWFHPKQQADYEKAIASFADHIIRKYHAVVLFIPQVTNENHRDDDRESSQKAYAYMEEGQDARVLTERYSHQTIKPIYGNLDYLVGTRFHSVIFALTSYVPSIAIGYEPKTLGIMQRLGLDRWVLDITKIDVDQLNELFDRLVLGRDSYLKHLREVLPQYVLQSQNSIFIVKKCYEEYIRNDKNHISRLSQ